ncbi:hypothetical protein CSC42_3816 [Pseudomonas aeruginosa]|nr:hypothetical protein CSC42_3816 [Pseudomonas aeruginosa]
MQTCYVIGSTLQDWLKNDQKVLSLCSFLIYPPGRWINENTPK